MPATTETERPKKRYEVILSPDLMGKLSERTSRLLHTADRELTTLRGYETDPLMLAEIVDNQRVRTARAAAESTVYSFAEGCFKDHTPFRLEQFGEEERRYWLCTLPNGDDLDSISHLSVTREQALGLVGFLLPPGNPHDARDWDRIVIRKLTIDAIEEGSQMDTLTFRPPSISSC